MRFGASVLAVTAPLLAGCGDGTGPELECAVEVSLAAGDVLASDPTTDDEGCGFLLSVSSGDRYRVAILRPDSAGSSSNGAVTLTVSGSAGGSPAPAAPSGSAAAPATFEPFRVPLEAKAATARVHARLRANERSLLRTVGAEHVLPSRPPGPLRAPSAAAPAKLRYDPAAECSVARNERVAVLITQNSALAIYQDSVDAAADAIDPALAEMLASFYETHGRAVVEEYFGAMPDIDGNGQVYIVIAKAAFTEEVVVAYMWGGNYFDRAECPASDESEIIFFNPDRVRPLASGDYTALGIVSHEAQHLVSVFASLGRATRLGNNAAFHPIWMEEGRAEIADEVTSRRAWTTVGAPGSNARVTRNDFARFALNPDDSCCVPESFGMILQMIRVLTYLPSQPNALVVEPDGADASYTIRDPGAHFHRWLADAYGNAGSAPGADASMFRSLTDSTTAAGRPGLEQVLGRTLEDLFEEFVAAIMLHGSSAPQPARSFALYDYITTTDILNEDFQPPGLYPWPVTTTGETLTKPFSNATYRGPIGPTGHRIHDFVASADGDVLLTVTGLDRYRVVFTRLR